MEPPISPSKKTLPSHVMELFKDSIKRIKNQKQRPGFERIAQTLKTHHAYTDLQQIKQNLDIAVRDGLLLPVWTKGLQCYKDPENLKSLRKFTVQSPADVRRAVKAAAREIGDPLGSKIPTITNYVRYSFTIRIRDLDASVQLAVEILAKKADLIKVEERYRSCHIAPPDSAGPNGTDLSSSLLDDYCTAGSSSLPSAAGNSTKSKPFLDGLGSSSSSSSKGTKRKLPRQSLPVVDSSVALEREKIGEIQQLEVDHHGQVKKAPRRFFMFQCWCCRFFSTSQDDFMKHVTGRSHADRTFRKIVYCNSCHFRSRDRKKLLGHLRKHNCHNSKRSSPACLLTFGLFTSLTE